MRPAHARCSIFLIRRLTDISRWKTVTGSRRRRRWRSARKRRARPASEQAARRRVTMTDVARLAECSQSTVSVVLNNTPGIHISASTRERVFAAARQLRYEIARSATVPGERPAQVAVVFDRIATSPEAVVAIDGIRESAWATGHRRDGLRDARQSRDGAPHARRRHARRDGSRRLCDHHDAQGRRAAPALRSEAAGRAARTATPTTAPSRASCRARWRAGIAPPTR